MLVKLLIGTVLLSIFYQDLRYRAIYWITFPVLWMLLFLDNMDGDVLNNSLYNLSFLLLQLFLLSLYFSLRNKKWVNITNGYLGWGDIVFLIVIAFFMAPLNFFMFYLLSLMLIVLVMIILNFGHIEKQYKIPLAGVQALFCAILFGISWRTGKINLQDDEWLLLMLSELK